MAHSPEVQVPLLDDAVVAARPEPRRAEDRRVELDALWLRWDHSRLHWHTVWALSALGL